jgi:hypothetical protein
MKSLKIIHKVLSYYQDKIKECSTIEDEEMINRELRHILDQCVERYPHLLLPFCNPSISGEEAAKLFEQVLVNVRDCNVPFFPTCNVISDVIGGKVIESPVYEGFDCSVISVDYENLNDLLLNILLSMLPGRVNLTFLESGKSFSGDFFYQNISPKLYSYITNDTDIREYFDRLKDRLIKMQQVYGNYPEYCNNNQVVPVPYEIIVLPKRCDSGDAQNDFYQRYKSEIDLISQNGQKAGIYIIKQSDLNDADRPHGYDVIVVSKVNGMDVADLTKSILDIDSSLSRGYICSEETDRFVSLKFRRGLLTRESDSEFELRRQIFKLLYPKFEFKILRQDIGESRLGPDVPRLIKPTYITENNTLLQACIEYLNKAAETDHQTGLH